MRTFNKNCSETKPITTTLTICRCSLNIIIYTHLYKSMIVDWICIKTINFITLTSFLYCYSKCHGFMCFHTISIWLLCHKMSCDGRLFLFLKCKINRLTQLFRQISLEYKIMVPCKLTSTKRPVMKHKHSRVKPTKSTIIHHSKPCYIYSCTFIIRFVYQHCSFFKLMTKYQGQAHTKNPTGVQILYILF